MPRDIDAGQEARLQAGVAAGAGDHHPCHSVRWSCVYTHPQAERWANQNLQRLGYVTFLPMATVWRRDRVTPSMRHHVSVPLFPRYLFLVFDAGTESWSPIRACPGVADLVRCGKVIPQIRDTAVEAVRKAVQAGEELAAMQPPGRDLLPPGTPVGLLAGVFRGHQGVVLRAGRKTALVSMLLFGQLRDVTVPFDALEARQED